MKSKQAIISNKNVNPIGYEKYMSFNKVAGRIKPKNATSLILL
ncbi:MAG: hypothetical protein QY318_01370 [Candidatus Dojkabacteria bacterium]|nr:MAG: hypothetical protein QY318_01370 [Candidatus Dojkabacteria bacterium]